jgi:methylthioribose-1-phosphate isomerase
MQWTGESLKLLDQRLLPSREVWLELKTSGEVAEAIRDMAVRGAPAIGIAAAYGMALAAKSGSNLGDAARELIGTRPTAINLRWAVERMLALGTREFSRLEQEAMAIEAEDLEMNLAIGRFGASLVPHGAGVLTICNTGGLATGGHGTALGVIRSAWEEGNPICVYSCETRPRQQGLRLTAWELSKDGIPFYSIADGAAASLLASGKIGCVIVGADRIAANGDTANKIGTYSLAVLAGHFGVPFYVAAPSSTLDPSLPSGESIPIEERSSEELTHIEGVPVGPAGCSVWNPAFDVTPGGLITAFITERGVHEPPFDFASSVARPSSSVLT